MSSDGDIAGFQFNVDGAEITLVPLVVQLAMQDLWFLPVQQQLLVFHFPESTIPAGEGVLVVVLGLDGISNWSQLGLLCLILLVRGYGFYL